MGKRQQQKGHDYSTLLIWAAALVTVVRYSAAFIASDVGEITGLLSETITILMGLSGLGMGILDTIGGAYLFDGWRRTMPGAGKKWPFRFKVLTVFVFLLIGTGVLILVPFTVSRVEHSSMVDVLNTTGLLFGWSFLVNTAPYLLIGGVAVGNQVVTVKVAESSNDNAESGGKLTGNISVTWDDWRKVPKSHREKIASMSTSEICSTYGVLPRTARNWRNNAQEEKEER